MAPAAYKNDMAKVICPGFTAEEASSLLDGLPLAVFPAPFAAAAEALAAVSAGEYGCALLPFPRSNPAALTQVARALWTADLFIVRMFAAWQGLLTACEPAPAAGNYCAVGGMTPPGSDPEAVRAAAAALCAREGAAAEVLLFPPFAPGAGTGNLWVNFAGSLNAVNVQRVLGGFEELTVGYRFFGNFS